jgi:hypothetical protein
MDGIYLLNKTRIMSSSKADGTVLKPDVPIHTSDSCFYQRNQDPGICWVYHTWTELEGLGRIHYHYNDKNDEDLTPNMVHLTSKDVGKYVIRNWYTGEVTLLNTTNRLAPGYEGHIYASVSPINQDNGWTLLGELQKYVVAASKRFGKVTYAPWQGGTSMSVEVMGIEGETVHVCAALKETNKLNLKIGCNDVHFEKTTTITSTFTNVYNTDNSIF